MNAISHRSAMADHDEAAHANSEQRRGADPGMRREGVGYGEALRSKGPRYAPHDVDAPMFEGKDIAGIVAAVTITLGPLAAYALGYGG